MAPEIFSSIKLEPQYEIIDIEQHLILNKPSINIQGSNKMKEAEITTKVSIGDDHDYADHPFGIGSNLHNKEALLDSVYNRMGGGYGIGTLSKQCIGIKCKDICISFNSSQDVVDFFELHKEDIIAVINRMAAKEGLDSEIEMIQKYASDLGCSDSDIERGIHSSVVEGAKTERLKVAIAKAAVNLVFIATAQDYIGFHEKSNQ